MNMFIRILFNTTATQALVKPGDAVVRIAPFTKARIPCFVFRESCKTKPEMAGFGAGFQIVNGQVLVEVPLAHYLANMENIAPPEDKTFFLKAKSVSDTTWVISGPAQVKDGKKSRVNEAFQVAFTVFDKDAQTPVEAPEETVETVEYTEFTEVPEEPEMIPAPPEMLLLAYQPEQPLAADDTGFGMFN